MLEKKKSVINSALGRRIEFGLILIVVALAAFGALMIYAAGGSDQLVFSRHQLLWLAAGVIVMTAAALFDYTKLKFSVGLIYLVNLVLLAAGAVFGKSALGAQRWIAVGSFHFQPSEFAKIVVIISLAAFLAERQDSMGDLRQVGAALLYVAPVILFIIIQPDLGTAAVILAVTISMMLIAGLKARHLALIILLGLILTAFLFQFHILKDYQYKRLVVFINPNVDPRGSSYNLRQSMIAIGSGKFRGKGLFLGTQSRLKFLPERHTDFIFSVIGEEFGFIGGSLLILGFLLLSSRALSIGLKSRNNFGLLIAGGIASMWFFQTITNIGMTIGIMPVTGIPLPFISYGGSAMLANMAAAGLLLSIYARRFS